MTDVAYDIDRYREDVSRLDLTGIDFGDFRTRPLSPDVLRCIRAMHDVEHHTSCYLRNLLNTPAHADPEVSEFMVLWAYEEHWHGEALAAVLAAHGEPAGRDRVARLRARMRGRLAVSPLVWMALTAVTPRFLALHMTIGLVNEWTTQAAYGRLAAVADHPTLTELLRRIMRQEGRHIDMYRSRAVAELEASATARRITRVVVGHLFHPVGATVMAPDEIDHLARTLFGGPEGAAVAARLDRRIGSLPGLGGMTPVRRFLERHAVPTDRHLGEPDHGTVPRAA